MRCHKALETKRVSINPDVLVVGGGIAGIHAALTLANAGKMVYLVEREATIGGHMAKFDKTFPTLDCAMCVLSPKMAAVGAHPNIHLWSYSEVTKVDGYVGNYTVQVKRKARYIIEDLCTGCQACVAVCPVDCIDMLPLPLATVIILVLEPALSAAFDLISSLRASAWSALL